MIPILQEDNTSPIHVTKFECWETPLPKITVTFSDGVNSVSRSAVNLGWEGLVYSLPDLFRQIARDSAKDLGHLRARQWYEPIEDEL